MIHVITFIEPKEVLTECKIDADCPSKMACFDGVCKNPCKESKPCIPNAKCSVVDSLPMRIMVCQCAQNFIGDATVACILADKKIEHICQSDSECSPLMACMNRRCVDPCGVNPCAETAECQIENHRHVCQCPKDFSGDPFINCYKGIFTYSGSGNRFEWNLADFDYMWRLICSPILRSKY